MHTIKPRQSLRRKFVAAFISVACFVAAFVGIAIEIHFETVERAAQLEAGHVAEFIAAGAIENNSFRPDLQEYVVRLNSMRKRDVFIVDIDKKGLADANFDEVGQTYNGAPDNEVGKTISDGRTRTFIEKSSQHSNGIHQIVVPLRQSALDFGTAPIGAVILEYTAIREEFFAAERMELYLITAAGILLVVLVTLFGLGVARQITQPLQDLKSSVERIAAKDYTARVAITSQDEISVLGRTFNRMAEDLSVTHTELAAHERELEMRVAERTRELDQSNTLLQQEVRQHRLADERAEYLAYYDSVTGLANQFVFLDRLEEKLLPARNDHRKRAVFVLDIERFKSINDAFGRQAGDALLKQIAERLVQCGGGDASRFGRIGGDRFAIVASDMDNAEHVGRYVVQRLEVTFREPFRINDSDLRVAVKVGIALFPDDGADAERLLRNAEAALKKAKRTGVRYLFFTQAMTELVAERLSLEDRLRQAHDREEFVLHYQPKIALSSGKLTGAEALIQWTDPSTGPVPQERLVSILEDAGLMHEVGRWMLRKAIEDYLRWRNAGLIAVRIAVNVTSPQLRSSGFVAEIQHAIDVDTHAAAGLELEIAESLLMEDVKHSIASLKAIRAMGVSIAVDEFGTGLSSLSYLSKLSVDRLKLDRSLVIEMTVAPEGLALVSTFINLAHSLKLKVVADGVETAEQSRLLRLLSCDEMQGYLFSKPVPSNIFETRYLLPDPIE